MMKKTLLILALATTFGFGFALKTVTTKQSEEEATMPRVTGIGGIFFKCKDPNKVKEWYKTNLGVETNEYGASFEWRESDNSAKKGLTQWTPFKETTKYFDPSTKDFMINYRVENIEALVEDLKKSGATILDTIQTYDYGKFVHVLDIEGNKLELWEPAE